jgi:hypothetical protein
MVKNKWFQDKNEKGPNETWSNYYKHWTSSIVLHLIKHNDNKWEVYGENGWGRQIFHVEHIFDSKDKAQKYLKRYIDTH